MTRVFCDRCKEEFKLDGSDSPFGAYEVRPGYVGKKVICGVCWGSWVHVIRKFFEDEELK